MIIASEDATNVEIGKGLKMVKPSLVEKEFIAIKTETGLRMATTNKNTFIMERRTVSNKNTFIMVIE